MIDYRMSKTKIWKYDQTHEWPQGKNTELENAPTQWMHTEMDNFKSRRYNKSRC